MLDREDFTQANHLDHSGCSALHGAAGQGHIEVIHALLMSGDHWGVKGGFGLLGFLGFWVEIAQYGSKQANQCVKRLFSAS